MAIKISITNIKSAKDCSIMNGTKINGYSEEDVEIKFNGLKTLGGMHLLDNFEITNIKSTLSKTILTMDKKDPEYMAIQELLCNPVSSPDSFTKKILTHIGQFTEGVLANIVSNYITK